MTEAPGRKARGFFYPLPVLDDPRSPMLQAHYRIDHIAHAVWDLQQAITEYEQHFRLTPCYRERRDDHGVELAFLDFGNTKVELLAPLGEKSPLSRFLDQRGPGLHHICYQVDDINAELARLKQLGYRLIDEVPRPGAMDTLVAFIHPKSMGGVLTELCQQSKAAPGPTQLNP